MSAGSHISTLNVGQLHIRRRKFVFAAAFVILLAGAGALAWRFAAEGRFSWPRAAGPVVNLGLRIERDGSNVRVAWNAQAPEVKKATGGLLSIRDGGAPAMQLALSPAQLRSGGVSYAPEAERVEFRLETQGAAGPLGTEWLMTMIENRAAAGAAAPPRPAAPPALASVQVPARGEADFEASRAVPPKAAEARAAEPERQPARRFVPPAPALHPALAPRDSSRDTASVLIAEPPNVAASRHGDALPLPPVAAASPPPRPSALKRFTELRPAPITYQEATPVEQRAPVLPSDVKTLLHTDVSVEIRVRIDAAGRVTSAQPVAYQGQLAILAGPSAAAAAARWRFTPAKRNGAAVASEKVLEFRFRAPR